jgi:GNAT superfamily N-acetyltransferase
MSSAAKISMCTHEDYNQILDELQEFWGTRDTRHLHHPFLVHEFGNSAFVIRNGAQVVAYLFGFLSQTEPVGYVHTVAVRTSARRQGLAGELFGHFVEFARRHGCRHVKAIIDELVGKKQPVSNCWPIRRPLARVRGWKSKPERAARKSRVRSPPAVLPAFKLRFRIAGSGTAPAPGHW